MSEHTLTSFQASADLPLPLSGQDSEPLLFVSETNSVKPSLKSTGRQSLAKPTFANSTEQNTKALTCSQGDFLASHTVAPGSNSARQMTVRSGLKCCALLRKQSPVGLLVKTLLESSIWNSTVVFLTWKPRVTPSKRLLFQLAPSMPGTDETEYGLWPTPSVPNGGRTMTPEDAINKGNTPNGKRQVGLENAVKFWPTPDHRDANAEGLEAGKRRLEKWGTLGLQTAVNLWRSPSASDRRNRGGMNNPSIKRRQKLGKQIGLTMQVGGQLNPQWVEWLMGYPPEWTALSPSEIASFRASRSRSSKQSRKSTK